VYVSIEGAEPPLYVQSAACIKGRLVHGGEVCTFNTRTRLFLL
jgi:hypothetical protein